MVPVPAPTLCALDTSSWSGSVGRTALPNGPRPWAGNGEPGAAVSRPSRPTVKLSITEVPTSVPASLVPVPLNSTSAGGAAAAEQEAGVVGVAGAGVGHVHQVAVHGNAVGQGAAGAGDADQAERAVEVDPQHGDLVAARVDGDQEPAVRRDLDRTLRGQPGASPGAAG